MIGTHRSLRPMQILLSLAIIIINFGGPVYAERHALLVGIGDYPQSALDLLGPENDINALVPVLQDVWEFKPDNIQVLLHKEATKSAVLGALKDLKRRSKPGDQLFFYFSGHGTSAKDQSVRLPLPDMTAGLLPYDAKLNLAKHEIVASLIVGRTDLRPIFRDIDQSGRQLLVIIDACYSGNAVRSFSLPGAKMPTRFVPLDNKVDSLLPDSDGVRTRAIAATASEEAYPYENVFFISASGEYEEAADISGPYLKKFPTIDGKPHGAFSDAMLRAFSLDLSGIDANGDNVVSHLETKQAIQGWMSGKFPQTPQHLPPLEEDRAGLASRSIFGAEALPGTILKARPQSATAGVAQNSPQTLAATMAQTTGNVNQGGTAQADAGQQVAPAAQPAPQSLPGNASSDSVEGFRIALDNSVAGLATTLQSIEGVVFTDVYPDLRILATIGGLELRNGANDLIISYPDGYENELLARVVQEVQVHAFLKRLRDNSAFDIALDVRGKQNNGPHLEGEMVSFSVRTGENAWIVLLDVDREGGINVLFPVFPHEQRVQPASLVLNTPEIEIVPPFGTDRIVALGFREKPEELLDWMGELPARISPRTPRLAEFYNLIGRQSAGSAIQELAFITVPRSG